MPSCNICIDNLQSPVSLPCGHIFCSECLLRAVEAIRPYSTLHSCPTCRSPYTVVNIDPAIVPSYLRPHLAPSIRKLYLDDQPSRPSNVPSTAVEALAEAARLNAENSALRTNCAMWRRRAEVHAAATLGLLGLARQTRDHAVRMKFERDEFQKRYGDLKRMFEDEESSFEQLSSDPSVPAPDLTSGGDAFPLSQLLQNRPMWTPSILEPSTALSQGNETQSEQVLASRSKDVHDDVTSPRKRRRTSIYDPQC